LQQESRAVPNRERSGRRLIVDSHQSQISKS
jgi:hypothetical protein